MSSISVVAPRLQTTMRPGQRVSSIIIRRLGGANRQFSSLPTLRPTTCQPVASSGARSTVFRTGHWSSPQLTLLPRSTDGSIALELAPFKASITAHPALGCGAQIRCAPRPTTARTSRLKRKRKFGFLARLRTKGGRKTIARRRAKGRHRLSGC